MVPVKRLEIVTGVQEFDFVTRILERFGITGYLVLKNVQGKGDRQVASVDLLTGETQTRLILTTCPTDVVRDLVEALRPVLSRFGGACIVYDAECVVLCQPGVEADAAAGRAAPTVTS